MKPILIVILVSLISAYINGVEINTEPECSMVLINVIMGGEPLEKLKDVVENGANINCRYSTDTPLILAVNYAYTDRSACVRYLIEQGANATIDAKNSQNETALSYAIRLGFFDVVKVLIEGGANIDVMNQNNLTPLMSIIQRSTSNNNDRAKTVEFLIQKGANVNIVNSVNETALYYAIKSKNMRIIELLVFGGADINGTGLARKPIFLAINFGNPKILELILNNGADPNAVIDNRTIDTALIAAIKSGINYVKVLIEYGADINAANKLGNTPLMTAAVNGKAEVIAYLLKNNADFNLANKVKKTAIILAYKNKQNGCIELLKQYHAKQYFLDAVPECSNHLISSIIRYVSLKELMSVVEDEPKMNCRTFDKHTPLTLAVIYYNEPELRVLLEFLIPKVDINAECIDKGEKYPKTALLYAAQYGKLDAIELLVRSGAKINGISSELGTVTPLNYVIAYSTNDRINVIKTLIKNGADVNLRDTYGDIPISLAVERNDVEIVKILIAAGAAVNVNMSPLDSLLAYAIKKKNNKIVQLLIQNGADLEEKNKLTNETLIHVATECGNVVAVSMIINYGDGKIKKNP